MRLIDADALLEVSKSKQSETEEIEPEVRHGRWIDAHFVSGGDFNRCSECGCYIEKTYFANDYNVRYCPACGARMDADHIADSSKKVGGAEK